MSYDSSALSLNTISKINGFYYVPVLKDESVSPRFCELSPKKMVKSKRKNDATLPSPFKTTNASAENPRTTEAKIIEGLSEEDILAVRRLESTHSRASELPLPEEAVVETNQDRILIARRLKLKSRGNLIGLKDNTSAAISTEYVHHFMDEDDGDLLNPLTFDARYDHVTSVTGLEAGSSSMFMDQNSSIYDNTIVCDYRYILDPSSAPTSPLRNQDSITEGSAVLSEEFLTYTSMTLSSRPNSRPTSNGAGVNRSRRNSSARSGAGGVSGNNQSSPVTKSISINLGNSPSGVVLTVDDIVSSTTVTTPAIAVSSPGAAAVSVSPANSPGSVVSSASVAAPAAPPPSGITASPNVVRRSSQRVMVPSVKGK